LQLFDLHAGNRGVPPEERRRRTCNSHSADTSRPTAPAAKPPPSPTDSGATSTRASTSATKPFRPTEATRGYLVPGQHIQLAALEDRESVQVALSVVINALATGNLEIKRATALLYGLQLASNNTRGLHTEPSATSVVRSIEPSADGLDLAQPGTLETDDLYHFNEDDDDENEEELDEQ
jgi:hypothetical protein